MNNRKPRCEKIVDSDMYKDVVLAEEKKWRQMGVDGVPFYIIEFPSGKKCSMSGAQSTAQWLKVFAKYS